MWEGRAERIGYEIAALVEGVGVADVVGVGGRMRGHAVALDVELDVDERGAGPGVGLAGAAGRIAGWVKRQQPREKRVSVLVVRIEVSSDVRRMVEMGELVFVEEGFAAVGT